MILTAQNPFFTEQCPNKPAANLFKPHQQIIDVCNKSHWFPETKLRIKEDRFPVRRCKTVGAVPPQIARAKELLCRNLQISA